MIAKVLHHDVGSGDGVTGSDVSIDDGDLPGSRHAQEANTLKNVTLHDYDETDLEAPVDSQTNDHNIGDDSDVVKASDSDSVTEAPKEESDEDEAGDASDDAAEESEDDAAEESDD